jgi:regulator of protease activity HflC (stomatin/prohibitin superfamily)
MFIIALLGLAVGLGLGRALDKSKKLRLPLFGIWGGLIGLFIGVCIVKSIFVVPAASVGAIYDPLRGGIQLDRPIPEGINLVSPFAKRAVFSVQTRAYTMSSVADEGAVIGDDSILCQTNEGLAVNLDLTVLFHVDPKRAPHVWENLGADFERSFIRPVVREAIRMAVAQYPVTSVYSGSRSQIQQEIDTVLSPTFSRYGLILEDIKVRSVSYANPEFKQAIENKQSAQQQVSTERRNLERASFEKETTINVAMGEYKAIAMRAQAIKSNPEIVNWQMARQLGPKTKRVYLQSPFEGGGH